MDIFKTDYVLVSGFAMTPKGTPVNEMYKYIGVTLLIDRSSNRILEANFTVVSNLTNKVLKDLVEGYCVDEPFENLTSKMKKHMAIPSLGAIQQAISAAIERYKEVVNKSS